MFWFRKVKPRFPRRICRPPASVRPPLPAARRREPKGAGRARGRCGSCGCRPPPPPPPPSRTDWTRLVPPPVLTGHVSSQVRLLRLQNARTTGELSAAKLDARTARAQLAAFKSAPRVPCTPAARLLARALARRPRAADGRVTARGRGAQARGGGDAGGGAERAWRGVAGSPPPPPRTNRTRRVPHPVLIGHAGRFRRSWSPRGRARGRRPTPCTRARARRRKRRTSRRARRSRRRPRARRRWRARRLRRRELRSKRRGPGRRCLPPPSAPPLL